ncbi:uncharacterized protein [Palaemon carinicauda]|uniref:uncharacterized protein n=1 Tax=Palaemon carinicauda TaxID=392227 RepID=UPI0035B5EC05
MIDLSALNRSIRNNPFKMETPRSVLAAIREGYFMIPPDLKDTYFQIPVHPSSRKYLRLKFGAGSLPVHHPRLRPIHGPAGFHKSVLSGVEVGVQAQLPTPMLPRRLVAAFSVKGTLGAATAIPSEKRIRNLGEISRPFLQGLPKRAKVGQRQLGHLASLEKLVPQGRIKLKPLQWNLKDHWNQIGSPTQVVPLSPQGRVALQWWALPQNSRRGTPLTDSPWRRCSSRMPPRMVEALTWHLTQHKASGRRQRERALHINVLEILAIQRALSIFKRELEGRTVDLMCDNATVVAYVKKQGSLRSRELCLITENILEWAERKHTDLTARFIPGKRNIIADGLSRKGQVLSAEWSLNPQITRDNLVD